MTKRRNFSDQFKAAVAFEALRGDKTVQEIAAKRQLHPTQVSTWKRQAVIPPFLIGSSRRIYAAVLIFMAGVMPPMPMLGRSLL